MKHILTILTIIFLTSCGNDDTVKIPKSEYKRLTGDTLTPKYPKPFKLYSKGVGYYNHGIVPASDGHEYLVYNNESHGMNVEHYIECEKCKTQK